MMRLIIHKAQNGATASGKGRQENVDQMTMLALALCKAFAVSIMDTSMEERHAATMRHLRQGLDGQASDADRGLP